MTRGTEMPSLTRESNQVLWPQSSHLTRAKPLYRSYSFSWWGFAADAVLIPEVPVDFDILFEDV